MAEDTSTAVADTPTQDAPDAPEAPEAPETSESPDTPESSDASEASDAPAPEQASTSDDVDLSTGIDPVDADSPAAEPRPLSDPATPDAGGWVWGTGRRKTSVARVRIRPAKDGTNGSFLVKGNGNTGREIDDYFSEPQHRNACVAPLEATDTRKGLEVFVNVFGGGMTGQAEAITLGVARALKGYDPKLEQTLRDEGFMSRDPRKVERKKYGQRGARRRFQFSKR
jgi:small subunit ribosomal protein S9